MLHRLGWVLGLGIRRNGTQLILGEVLDTSPSGRVLRHVQVILQLHPGGSPEIAFLGNMVLHFVLGFDEMIPNCFLSLRVDLDCFNHCGFLEVRLREVHHSLPVNDLFLHRSHDDRFIDFLLLFLVLVQSAVG